MINARHIFFLGWMLFTGVIISLIVGQDWYGSGDVTTINALTVIRPVSVLGIWSFPFLNLQYFTVGIPKLFSWDMGFFGGGYGVIKYGLQMVFTAGIGLVLAIAAWQIGRSLFPR